MITKEKFEKAVEVCNSEFKTCEDCPLRHKAFLCGVYLTKYIKNELASAATGTSSEVSKDTDNIHIDDSTLLNICQEGIEEMAKIALDDYPNEFLTGYIESFKGNMMRLRCEDSD